MPLKIPDIQYYMAPEDEIVLDLPCIQSCIYYLLKTEFQLPMDQMIEPFLRDTTISLRENETGDIHEIGFTNSVIPDLLFQRQYILGKGSKTFAEVLALLDQGKTVIIQAYAQRLPFHKDFAGFDAPFDEQEYQRNYQAQHTFVALAHDAENLYYVEIPYEMNPVQYVPYPENDTVGVVTKRELEPAFDLFLNYTYITMDPHQIPDMYKALLIAIDQTVDNFDRFREENGGKNTYFGREAMERIKKHLCNPQFNLRNRVPSSGATMGEYLLLHFRGIARRRSLLQRGMVKYRERMPGAPADTVIQRLNAIQAHWNTIILNIRKMCIKYEFKSDASFQKVVTELAAWENQLIDELKTLQTGFPGPEK
jgi:hypothetical protein